LSNGNPGWSARLLPQAPARARPPRIRKGDVKSYYVRIRRRWVRVGTICLDCAEFAPDL